MFRVTLPSNSVFVTPEQLPRFLANLAETRYVAQSGEFLQTTSTHELVQDSTTATLLIKKPFEAAIQERDTFKSMWKAAQHEVDDLMEDINRAKQQIAKHKVNGRKKKGKK